ncbi:hypothetical protein JF781_20650 [Mycobacterium sp. WUMAC-067]|uniref:hypothetical protein n=1 Tax=unclassified Mycobacterium TaxID=2642494 RepID=UPI001CD9A563|nr:MULTISPECIES: hypothetical protein [unclassified Mycobacterium]MCA2244772.1 hypothetical protein [Mycobacterium sp. WUMAC-067]MCA2315982.1 hypothetical protein [Mycobacterium sp. WUMAC-025]
MARGLSSFTAADEDLHPIDPGDWSWNESWFLSWIDANGGPAGVFRVGVTPNQDRAMLWCFVHVNGAWLTIEESRLNYADIAFDDGVAYDKWGLTFSSRDEQALSSGHLSIAGTALVRSGPQTGARVPLSVELDYAATGPLHGTGIGPDEGLTRYATGRFEQSLSAKGFVTVGDQSHAVRAGAHRDKSWGPRDWRKSFAMGDLQTQRRQLYFVGSVWPELAMGYLRDDSDHLQTLTCIDAHFDYLDEQRTIKSAELSFRIDGGGTVDVSMVPVSDSIVFDIAHTCQQPEHWLYWRTLVQAEVSGWEAPARGWFESSRYDI